MNETHLTPIFFELLNQLTACPTVKTEEYLEAFWEIMLDKNIYIIVLVNKEKKNVIGAGRIFFEKKFTHNCRILAHIEDVVVVNLVQKV